ncbi:hypothetical protein [Chromobacterium alticapitis]|uniref:Uncharacterized protein n=1 Tax=Chromobacterium alticapitis TaxID=2073169 RepID=A0A2S5DCT5_9NEIS|nr:hypothetical protein [Chromobacterium alticapitis]POZ60818.1 hypothetical protein C2I19_16860 [Chromobacterium alticapitis]
MSWTVNAQAFPVEKVSVLSASGNNGVDAALAVTGGRGTSSVTVAAPMAGSPAVVVPFLALGASGSSRQVQLRTRQPDGLRLFDQTIYRN